MEWMQKHTSTRDIYNKLTAYYLGFNVVCECFLNVFWEHIYIYSFSETNSDDLRYLNSISSTSRTIPHFWRTAIYKRCNIHSAKYSLRLYFDRIMLQFNFQCSTIIWIYFAMANTKLNMKIEMCAGWAPSKHGTLNQCWFNVDPAS